MSLPPRQPRLRAAQRGRIDATWKRRTRRFRHVAFGNRTIFPAGRSRQRSTFVAATWDLSGIYVPCTAHLCATCEMKARYTVASSTEVAGCVLAVTEGEAGSTSCEVGSAPRDYEHAKGAWLEVQATCHGAALHRSGVLHKPGHAVVCAAGHHGESHGRR